MSRSTKQIGAIIGVVVFGVACVGVGVAFGSGAIDFNQATPTEETGGSTTPQPVQDAPEEVENAKPQAKALLIEAKQSGYQNASVHISREGHILIEYDTQATSETQLKSEMSQLAIAFGKIDGEARSVTVATGNIQAVVPEASVEKYRSGELNDKAYKETIAYRNIDDSENGDS